MQRFDVIVIGQGYAGLKAARFAIERSLRTATVEKMFPGGLVMGINHLDPAPSGENGSGADLIGELAMSNLERGVTNLEGPVTALMRNGDEWTVAADGRSYAAPHVIVASGARLRKLGVPGEDRFAGMGVSECADCDGPMFQGRDAVVVGGGDSAFQEAATLAAYARSVTIMMRGETPRARPHLVEAALRNPAITVLPFAEVVEILGDNSVTGVRIHTPDGENALPCSAVFVFVGLKPDVGCVPEDVRRDEAGALVTGDDLSVGMPGLWVIGAARSKFGGLLSDASADAKRVIAAL